MNECPSARLLPNSPASIDPVSACVLHISTVSTKSIAHPDAPLCGRDGHGLRSCPGARSTKSWLKVSRFETCHLAFPAKGTCSEGTFFQGNLFQGNLFQGNLFQGNLFQGNLFKTSPGSWLPNLVPPKPAWIRPGSLERERDRRACLAAGRNRGIGEPPIGAFRRMGNGRRNRNGNRDAMQNTSLQLVNGGLP